MEDQSNRSDRDLAGVVEPPKDQGDRFPWELYQAWCEGYHWNIGPPNPRVVSAIRWEDLSEHDRQVWRAVANRAQQRCHERALVTLGSAGYRRPQE